MEIEKVESAILTVALKELIDKMEIELAERKAGGNDSLDGDEELQRVKDLKSKIDEYLKGQFTPATPFSQYPKLLGL